VYSHPVRSTEGSENPSVRVVENETDLYYHMAVEMYRDIEKNNRSGRSSVYITPVGPTFQYRRIVWLCRMMPIDLSRLHLFFMDEYLADGGDTPIDAAHPLSFRGFIQRELVDTLKGEFGFDPNQVYFPDPADPGAYDRRLAELGGAEICFAGVGINGHLAFNEPPVSWEAPSRIVSLSRETITINSNTALGGAWEQVPGRAITVGMRQIIGSRRLMIYLNRPWQRAVVRKMLYGPVTETFPASWVQKHPDATVTLTAAVAEPLDFVLQ
jgi:glucosamine-6-phosphate deaminase